MHLITRGSRLRAAILIAVLACGGLVPAPASAETGNARHSAAPETCREVNVISKYRYQYRYAGADRYETAVCASYWSWPDHGTAEPMAKAVVLARGDLYADALAGGPLAGHVNGPLLLNPPQSLLPSVKAEIQRVLAPGGTVYLLGSTGALSSSVSSALMSAGFVPKRLAGADRFQTAIRIAQELPSTNRFFVATGSDFADALPAGAYSASHNLRITRDGDPATNTPIALLFTDNHVMPASTRDFITARWLDLGRSTLFAAGGSASTAAIRAFGGEHVHSFVGDDRFGTAAEIAEHLYTDSSSKLVGTGVGLTNGMNFPDALAATTALMLNGNPLLLAPPTALPYATRSFMVRHAEDIRDQDTGHPNGDLYVFGGTSVVPAEVVNAAVAAYLR